MLGEQRKGEVPGLVVCSDGSGDWEVTLVVVRGIVVSWGRDGAPAALVLLSREHGRAGAGR